MPTNKTKRPKFFEGQYLGAEDLMAGVRYSHVQRARHLLGAHTWGIAMGLKLKEVPTPAGNDQVDMYLTPGYAWDGFGRPIVVLAPYQLPSEKFKSCPGDVENGSLIEVWLRYDESATQGPRTGFKVCDVADQYSRVRETFGVEVGRRPNHSDRHDPIIVAGHSLEDGRGALQVIEPDEPYINDESIPHQVLPDDDDDAWWLIPLGYVRWKSNPDPNQPGHFVALSEEDREESRRSRQYIGVVAEGIQAADGIIRLQDRTIAPSKTWSDDLVWVEGDLRIDKDLKLFGGQLDFRDRLGNPQEDNSEGNVPLVIKRVNTRSGTDLQVLIGRSESGANCFAVGPRIDDNFAARLVIRDDGHIGIGAQDPEHKLQIGDAGTAVSLALRGPENNPESSVLTFEDNGDSHWFKIIHDTENNQLKITSAEIDPLMVIERSNGNIGVGTTNPSRKFHVLGDRIRLEKDGKHLDLRADGGAVDLQSDTNNLYIRSTNSNNVIINALEGDGKVGIGTPNPLTQLHVVNNISGGAGDISKHVVLVENISTTNQADVLALKVGINDPGAGNNFITFFAGNEAIGAIEINSEGKISINTESADYAEWLPRMKVDEEIAAGDIVGVFGGKIARVTQGADHLLAISSAPLALGNRPSLDESHLYEKVAFLGQLPVKVRGAVQAGDFIIPSGSNDGTGVARPSSEITLDECPKIVGRAWESSEEEGVKKVNVAVGLSSNIAKTSISASLANLQEEMEALKSELEKLKASSPVA